tara:strand:- start:1241 stop:2221 length:981 start_codon:yes stop_codon:yes gene_type:complete
MANKSKKEITEAIKAGLKHFKEQKTLDTKNFEDPALGHDTDGKAQKIAEPVATGNEENVATLAPHGEASGEKKKEEKEEMKEETSTIDYLSSLFHEDELSEEFMNKLTTIFDTALNDRISFVESSMQESFNNSLNEQIETITEDLSEKLDEFLTYVVEEWTKENTLAIERGIQADIAESFITGLKTLFQSHYIELPEEKVDVVEELLSVKEKLETELNEEIEKNLEFNKEIIENKAQIIFDDISADLTDTEAERFSKLLEGVVYESEEDYHNKLSIIKESFISSRETETTTELKESTDTKETTHDAGNDPLLEAYSKAITFQNRNR